MKTTLPKSIRTVEQAKILLFSLIINGESFHPEDNPFDIIWRNDPEPSKNEKHWLSSLMTDIYNLPEVNGEKFDPCGFILDHTQIRDMDWVETHHEIVEAIALEEQKDEDAQSEMVLSTRSELGTGGIYELAIELTNEFQAIHAEREWDGEFPDEIETFINSKF